MSQETQIEISGQFVIRDKTATGINPEFLKKAMQIIADRFTCVETDDIGPYAASDVLHCTDQNKVEAVCQEIQEACGDMVVAIFIQNNDPYDLIPIYPGDRDGDFSESELLHREFVINRIHSLINCLSNPDSVHLSA